MSTLALVLAIAGTALTALALPALVLFEYAERADLRYLAKPLASAGFLVVGAAAGGFSGGLGAPGPWILIGLALGAVGDVALMFAGQAAFLAGLGAFLAGHVAYVVAFSREVAIATWPHAPVWMLAPIAIATLVALGWLWDHLGEMLAPVIAYVAVIATMVVGAAVCADAGPTPLHRWLALAGAILFYASDLAVARDKFVRPGFVNRAWGLPTYYAAQLLLAWSIAG